MKIVFDTKGNAKQKEAVKYWIDNTTEEILYGGAKYGASHIWVALLFLVMLYYIRVRSILLLEIH